MPDSTGGWKALQCGEARMYLLWRLIAPRKREASLPLPGCCCCFSPEDELDFDELLLLLLPLLLSLLGGFRRLT